MGRLIPRRPYVSRPQGAEPAARVLDARHQIERQARFPEFASEKDLPAARGIVRYTYDALVVAGQPLQCNDSRRTGIVFGIMVKAAISLMDPGLVANSIEKLRESIDNTRRISTPAR